MKSLCLLIFTSVFYGCNLHHGVDSALEASAVDSFTVSGIDVGLQVQHVQYFDDSLLYSYDKINSRMVYFKKESAHSYKALKAKSVNTAAWSSHFSGDHKLNYFIDEKNRLSVYDSLCNNLLYKKQLSHHFKYLENAFTFYAANNAPIIMRHDTLISTVAHSVMESYSSWFKESSFSEFIVTKDSVRFLRSYIHKPKNLHRFRFPFETYCFHKNTLYMLYPPMDTLYTFNRNTNREVRIPIHNPEYTMPTQFDNNKVWGAEAGSYQTKYSMKNFQYASVFYNEGTRHFILFYYAAISEAVNTKNVTPKDQKLKALILNENMEKVACYYFTKPFVTPVSFFIIPGKGLAMPVYKGDDAYETTTFYIYNL
jgi:hypothetical protein